MSASRIIVVAHDSMKPKLETFLSDKEDWLWGRTLVATGQTAVFVEEQGFSVPISRVARGREGGYLELRTMVEAGEVDLVVFFRDPEIVQDYALEVTEFVKACMRENVPLAVNPSSAELLILGIIKSESAAKLRARS